MWSRYERETIARRTSASRVSAIVSRSKGLSIGFVDLRHLLHGGGKDIDDILYVLDFVERKRSALPALKIFVDDLIAANVEIPNIGRHRREALYGINCISFDLI